MIRAGLGVGQPLQCYVEDDLKNGRLVAVLEEWQRPSVPYMFFTHLIRMRDYRCLLTG
jgi:DNA-binding transcriptional LysR family regulator